MKTPHDIVQTILVTEKNNDLKETGNKYVFRVHPDAGKIEIGKAVEKLFKVKVKSVNVINYKGKPKRAGKSPRMGYRPDWKKAIVTLSEGAIDFL